MKEVHASVKEVQVPVDARRRPHSPSPHNSQAVPRRPGLVCGREARLLRRGQDALGPAQVDVGRVAQALPLRRLQHEKIP